MTTVSKCYLEMEQRSKYRSKNYKHLKKTQIKSFKIFNLSISWIWYQWQSTAAAATKTISILDFIKIFQTCALKYSITSIKGRTSVFFFCCPGKTPNTQRKKKKGVLHGSWFVEVSRPSRLAPRLCSTAERHHRETAPGRQEAAEQGSSTTAAEWRQWLFFCPFYSVWVQAIHPRGREHIQGEAPSILGHRKSVPASP